MRIVDKHFQYILLLSFVFPLGCGEPQSIDPLREIIKATPSFVSELIDNPVHEVQIRYTQIERDKNNQPHFYSFDINRNDHKYFYPASTVKMPVAFLALQRINELKKDHISISRSTRMAFDSISAPQSPMYIDSSSHTGYPNVQHFIEQIFSVSDNEAYIRLYEFLGQDYINQELKKKGIFRNSRIRTRVGISGFNTEANKYTNPVKLIDEDGITLYEQPEYYALYSSFDSVNFTNKGKGYYVDDLDSIVMEPFDMSEKNFINLTDLEASLIRVIFPESFPPIERYELTESDYDFLYQTMPKSPLDFSFNHNHADQYYDSYVKFFYNGDSKEPIPEYIKIYNKVGWAYGTLTDCSYIIDIKNNIEFFLTATILVNENEIFNDGNYEYEEKGLPFFATLGKAVYNYELKRERAFTPDLSKFK